jgi:hypothetical protein
MSNNPFNPPAGLGIGPAPANDAGPDGRSTTCTVFELPGDREATVFATFGVPPVEEQTAAEARRIEWMTNTDPNSLTEGLQREVDELERKLKDFDGFDREGKPKMRFTGRERDRLVMRHNVRLQALELAKQQAAQIRAFQQQQQKERAASEARVEAAARAKAAEMLEQERIDRRARLLVAQGRAKRS